MWTSFNIILGIKSIIRNFFFRGLRPKTYFFALTFITFIIVSIWNLSRTWILGFHSMKQIYLGIIFGIIEFLIPTTFFFKNMSKDNTTKTEDDYKDIMKTLLLINIFTWSLSIINLGFTPFKIEDITLFIIAWIIAFYGYSSSSPLKRIE